MIILCRLDREKNFTMSLKRQAVMWRCFPLKMQIMQISISSKSRYGMRFVLSLRQSCKQRKRGLLFFRKAILSPLPRSAVEGTWTPTQVHGHEPESCAYANSATTANTLVCIGYYENSAGDRTWTCTSLTLEPKSSASANSATPACYYSQSDIVTFAPMHGV